jgi:hypothetical protein
LIAGIADALVGLFNVSDRGAVDVPAAVSGWTMDFVSPDFVSPPPAAANPAESPAGRGRGKGTRLGTRLAPAEYCDRAAAKPRSSS